MQGISVKWRHYLGMIHFMYAKSNLNHFPQKPPSMEAISQIIRSVGLFVSSSPEVTISTKIQPFLYLLKNGSIEVPDLVYSLPNCGDVVSLILWWNITVWAWQVILFIFFSWKLPYFSIAHVRKFGHVTLLIWHDPFCVCEIKPQPLPTKTSKYGGHISNNKVCRFICFK